MAKALYLAASPSSHRRGAQRLEWAALLHEIGYSVSHIGFHKHGAYILENADMPGFSAQDQRHLALLVMGCRGGLSKMAPLLADDDLAAQMLALRLAVLFHHARREIDAPRIKLEVGRQIRFAIVEALAEGASAHRAPARSGARRVGRAARPRSGKPSALAGSRGSAPP